jgi:hypothetical protein
LSGRVQKRDLLSSRVPRCGGRVGVVISSGPLPYGDNQVVLPDAVIVSELQPRGQVFRTNVDDAACTTNAAKIGLDADGRPGGCDAIQVTIGGTPSIQVAIFRGSD